MQFKCVVEISVRWSGEALASALSRILKMVVSPCLTAKEVVMSKLHEIVSFGAALLPVPGWPKLHSHRD